MTVIGVRFKRVGKVYYFDPCGLTVKPGQHVIVETARGVECGECAMGNTEVSETEVVSPLKKIIRLATERDMEITHSNEQQAREAYQIAKRKIAEHKLDMRLVAVECTFDLNKILFYFTADGRVDFRDLVKDLASVFRTRIELRQIGVRDEAKMIGGLGICGRELCCASYLDDFHPVSINMAKEQNLSLNPTKISGTCGRLMCCLKYEHEVYAELQKVTPKPESLVETPEGRGTVLSTQMLRGTCRVQLEDAPDEPKVFSCADCKTLRSGRAKKCPNQQGRAQTPVEIDPMAEQKPAAVGEPEQPRRSRRSKSGERLPREARENRAPRAQSKRDAAPKPTTEPAPEAPARPPRREGGDVPRLVKAAAKPAAVPAPRPVAPAASERPRLVKAAPKPAPDSAAPQTAPAADEAARPAAKRRRRRGGVRRRKPGEASTSAPAEE